jgi:hypothetical protein
MLDKKVRKNTASRLRGNLVYYLNPSIVNREGRVFFEDFMKNTMDYQTFFNNFQRHQNDDGELVNPDAKYLWDNGIVEVDNYSTLRFFKDTDPIIQQLIQEYENAADEDKPDVFIKLSDIGLDREGALEDEVARLRAELAALKANEELNKKTKKDVA